MCCFLCNCSMQVVTQWSILNSRLKYPAVCWLLLLASVPGTYLLKIHPFDDSLSLLPFSLSSNYFSKSPGLTHLNPRCSSFHNLSGMWQCRPFHSNHTHVSLDYSKLLCLSDIHPHPNSHFLRHNNQLKWSFRKSVHPTYVVANGSSFLTWLQNILLCMYTSFSYSYLWWQIPQAQGDK